VGASLVIVFVIAQYAPGQVGYDIEELQPIPPIPQALPSPMPSLPPPAPPAEEPDRPRFGIVQRDDGGLTVDAGTFRADVDPEGRVRFEDKSVWAGYGALTIFGRFGKIDPYHSEKRRFLESTFEDRLAMRERYAASAMDAALADLPRYLAAVWRADWALETRKRVLFDLWDECAEWGRPELVEGGREARHIITEFIQRYLPPGTDEAYTARELTALNNDRTSAEPFRPYVLSSRAEVADESSEPVSHPVVDGDRAGRVWQRRRPGRIRQAAK